MSPHCSGPHLPPLRTTAGCECSVQSAARTKPLSSGVRAPLGAPGPGLCCPPLRPIRGWDRGSQKSLNQPRMVDSHPALSGHHPAQMAELTLQLFPGWAGEGLQLREPKVEAPLCPLWYLAAEGSR